MSSNARGAKGARAAATGGASQAGGPRRAGRGAATTRGAATGGASQARGPGGAGGGAATRTGDMATAPTGGATTEGAAAQAKEKTKQKAKSKAKGGLKKDNPNDPNFDPAKSNQPSAEVLGAPPAALAAHTPYRWRCCTYTKRKSQEKKRETTSIGKISAEEMTDFIKSFRTCCNNNDK